MAAPLQRSMDYNKDCVHEVQLSKYTYVFDWAALIEVSKVDPLAGPVRGIRAFAIPNGFAMHTGVRGHYIINSTNEIEAGVISLPAIVEFMDGGVADVMALSFKLADNGKMYAQCVNLPLLVGKSKEGKETWVDERRAALVNLEVIKRFKAVENFDGCAHGKHLDKFLNLHFSTFRAIGLKSAIQCRKYALAGKYVGNMLAVVQHAELKVRRGVKAAAGGRGVAVPTSSTTAAQENHAAELSKVAELKAALQLAHEQLLENTAFYNAPLSERLIHCPLNLAQTEGAVLNTEALEELVRKMSSNADEILNLIKKGDLTQLLAEGKAKLPALASRLLFKTSTPRVDEPNTGESTSLDGTARNINFGEDEFNELANESEGEAGVDAEEEERGARELEEQEGQTSTATGKAPTRASTRKPVKSVKAAGKATGKRPQSAIIVDDDVPKPKRKYVIKPQSTDRPAWTFLARSLLREIGNGD